MEKGEEGESLLALTLRNVHAQRKPAAPPANFVCFIYRLSEREREKNCKVYNNTAKKKEAKTKYARYHAVEQKRENKNE